MNKQPTMMGRRPQMTGERPKISGKTLTRLISYIKKNHAKKFILVIVCIILSTLAGVMSSVFLKKLIDGYITPLLSKPNPVFTGLFFALCIMVVIYVIGILTSYIYNRTMVVIAQGVLKDIRDEMFDNMQELPIKYFDKNSHGDIMSRYTNDTDTLRQMFSQSLPQLISSIISIVAVFCAMVYINWLLAIFVILASVLTLFITKTVAGKSSKYFVKQQQSIRRS